MPTPSSIPLNAYPLASERGEAIPLEALRPMASRLIAAGGPTSYPLLTQELTQNNLVLFRSTASFTVQAGEEEPEVDGWLPNAIHCSPGQDYYLVLGSSFTLTNTAEVAVTQLTVWAQMANLGAYRSF